MVENTSKTNDSLLEGLSPFGRVAAQVRRVHGYHRREEEQAHLLGVGGPYFGPTLPRENGDNHGK